ncbi:MAG: HAD hydrolase-like protein, partial [Butyrivibrio sp.]|nr:HAD hydrolase-like protein [Butyrivibrio sp.]
MTQLQLSDKLGVSDKTNSKGSYFMSKINTVIFDMDGTVLNTLDDLTTSVNYTMEKFGFPQRTLDEYRQAFGSGIRRAIELTVPEGTSQEVIDEMVPVFK